MPKMEGYSVRAGAQDWEPETLEFQTSPRDILLALRTMELSIVFPCVKWEKERPPPRHLGFKMTCVA